MNHNTNESEHLQQLCDHLNSIGVLARVIEKNGPEAIQHHVPIVFNNPLKAGRAGVVLVESRNVQYVELIRLMFSDPGHYRSSMPPVQLVYHYVYALRAEVKGNEKALEATSRPVIRSPSPGTYHLKGIVWDGKELAARLQSDVVLNELMVSSKLVDLHVEGDGKDAYVAIVKEGADSYQVQGLALKMGYGDFPTTEEFEIFDRIAGNVRGILHKQ
jgi:hypothetical protein